MFFKHMSRAESRVERTEYVSNHADVGVHFSVILAPGR